MPKSQVTNLIFLMPTPLLVMHCVEIRSSVESDRMCPKAEVNATITHINHTYIYL